MTHFLRLLTAILPGGIVAVSLQDLMDTLTAYAEALGYLLKGPTLLPEPGNGWVVSGIDPRVRMGMFEEEPTPVEPAIFGLTGSHNDAGHLTLLGALDAFSQSIKWTVGAIEPSDLL